MKYIRTFEDYMNPSDLTIAPVDALPIDYYDYPDENEEDNDDDHSDDTNTKGAVTRSKHKKKTKAKISPE